MHACVLLLSSLIMIHKTDIFCPPGVHFETKTSVYIILVEVDTIPFDKLVHFDNIISWQRQNSIFLIKSVAYV